MGGGEWVGCVGGLCGFGWMGESGWSVDGLVGGRVGWMGGEWLVKREGCGGGGGLKGEWEWKVGGGVVCVWF